MGNLSEKGGGINPRRNEQSDMGGHYNKLFFHNFEIKET